MLVQCWARCLSPLPWCEPGVGQVKKLPAACVLGFSTLPHHPWLGMNQPEYSRKGDDNRYSKPLSANACMNRSPTRRKQLNPTVICIIKPLLLWFIQLMYVWDRFCLFTTFIIDLINHVVWRHLSPGLRPTQY